MQAPVVSFLADRVPKLTAAEASALERKPAGVRGYWLDEELLRSTGLGSVAILKKVQATGLVQPGYVPLPQGSRRRAWTLREVALAELAAEFSKRSLIAIQSAAALLMGAGRDWIDAAVGLEDQLKMASGDKNAGAIPVAPTRILVIDMATAWAETPDGFVQIAADLTLKGLNNDLKERLNAFKSFPDPLRLSRRESLDGLLDQAAVATVIALDAMPIHSIDLAAEALLAPYIEDAAPQ